MAEDFHILSIRTALLSVVIFVNVAEAMPVVPLVEDPNRYLNAVIEFADNVLKYGRDTYGPKHTPLFVDGLMVRDPNNPDYGKDGVFKPVEWIAPNGDRWILSNLASQQNLFRTLDGLTTITGDPKYKQAAMDAIRYAFDNLRSPNGLFYWGGYAAYDARADKPYIDIHVLKGFYPYYELMWEVSPKVTKDFIESFWACHILDWSNLDMNRLANLRKLSVAQGWDHEYKGGPVPFFSEKGGSQFFAGADLFYAAAWLTKFTGDERPLVWGKRLAHRYVETRNPGTGISLHRFSYVKLDFSAYKDESYQKAAMYANIFPVQSSSNREMWRVSRCGYDMPTPGVILDMFLAPWIGWLMVGELAGKENKDIAQWVQEELTAWGKVAYRGKDNTFIPIIRSDGTNLEGYVCKEDGPLGFKGTRLESVPLGTTEFWAYALAYCLTEDDFMWQMARDIAIGNNYGDLGSTSDDKPRLNLQTDIADPYLMWVFLELNRRIGKRAFLEMSQRIGDNILARRFHNGLVVPSSQHTYTKFDAIDSLALLHLYATLAGDCSVKIPKVWPATPFFEAPYRNKDKSLDNQHIYTLRGLFDPAISLQEAAADGNMEMIKSIIVQGSPVDRREDGYWKTALHWAAIKGHKGAVELLLDEGADINTKDNGLRTALHYAAMNGYEGITEMLIVYGADLDAQDIKGNTPLDIALQRNHRAIADLLIQKGAVVSLHTAARYGLQEKLKELIAEGTDINAKDNAGRTALDVAVEEYDKDIVKLLVDKGADVSVHAAAFIGDINKVKTFIEQGGSVDAVDASGRTPLYYAVAENHKDIVELLVSKGANVNVIAGGWNTPLTAAIQANSIETVVYLIDHGANVNCREGQRSPIREAAKYSKEIVELLLNKGANINAGKFTALHNALDVERFDIVEVLLDKDADVNVKDDDGSTPLHIAASYAAKSNPKVVELLISKGADINAKDNNGKTALSLAKENGHTEIVEILRKHGAIEEKEDKKPESVPAPKEDAEVDSNIPELNDYDAGDLSSKETQGFTPAFQIPAYT